VKRTEGFLGIILHPTANPIKNCEFHHVSCSNFPGVRRSPFAKTHTPLVKSRLYALSTVLMSNKHRQLSKSHIKYNFANLKIENIFSERKNLANHFLVVGVPRAYILA
jgi:hypothetical protein